MRRGLVKRLHNAKRLLDVGVLVWYEILKIYQIVGCAGKI